MHHSCAQFPGLFFLLDRGLQLFVRKITGGSRWRLPPLGAAEAVVERSGVVVVAGSAGIAVAVPSGSRGQTA